MKGVGVCASGRQEKRPLVSIGMTVYNQERYVARAIESILMQKVNFEYEIVIAEDCSTDRSRQIVMDYADRYPNVIRLILQEENVGLRMQSICLKKTCRGIYRGQLEGDDYWLTDDKLQKQVDFLETHPDYIAVSGRIQCVNERNHLCAFPYGALTSIYQFDEEYTIKDFERWLLPSHTGALLYRNVFYNCDTVFLNAYESVDVMGDRKTALMLIAQGRIYIMPEVVSVRRIALKSEANFTSNSVKIKPYATICAWMDALERMADQLFHLQIDLQAQKQKQWIWALKNFARNPTRTNLRGLWDIYKMSREKGRYIKDIFAGLWEKTKKKVHKEGFWRAAWGIVKFPFTAVRKIVISEGADQKIERAMNVISSSSVAKRENV